MRRLRPRELPQVDQERVRELARHDPEGDGRLGRKYERESPPMTSKMRAFLESRPTIDHPQEPGIYALWEQGRIVFIGGSLYGLFGPTVAAHDRGTRPGVQAKKFSKLTFVEVPEDLLDHAIAAFVRALRPKYNRIQREAFVDDLDQARLDREILSFLGVSADGLSPE